MSRKLLFFTLLVAASAANGSQQEVTLGTLSRKFLHLDITMIDDAETVFILRQVSQPLIDYDANGQIVASVAKYWTVSKDMKTYDFYIRDNLKFSEGSPLTARDVVFSLNKVKTSEFNPLRIHFDKVSTMEAVSDKQVRIVLKHPWSGFLHCIASGLAPIFSLNAYTKDNSFVGSGPYRLFAKGDRYYLERNRYYSGIYPPKVSRFKILTERDSDKPDIAINNFDRFISDRYYSKVESDSFSGSYLMFNPSLKKWKDKKKRMALMKVFLSMKKSFFGAGRTELKDIFPKGMPGFDINHRAYDRLLRTAEDADASLLKGERIVISSPQEIPNFILLEKRFKAEFNVNLENRVVDVRHALPEMTKDRSVDVFAFGWNSIFSHPDASMTPFYILGFQDLDDRIPALIGQTSQQADQIQQNLNYRTLAALMVENGYVLPLGQKNLTVLTKPMISMSKYRYRYTLQLSEITVRD